MIIGTAGHVDHGKTTLVRALTGVDTDRLPEEKRRGMSIELGYAYLEHADPGSDSPRRLAFIDVPGHERLLHTMLAGASGIEHALLLVAADDGVMPQTREHAAVLALLGIERGTVVITKCDRVDAARIDEVGRAVRELLAPTPLAAAPILPVSALAGTGIETLKARLLVAERETAPRDASRGFRVAIDRVFTLAGVGTVVTGTAHDGEVRVGDELEVQPAGQRVRVRGLRAQNAVVAAARAGDRCALAVTGVAKDELSRGQWLCAPSIACASARIDVLLQMWPGEPAALRASTTVHVHLGTSNVLATVVPLAADRLLPGASGVAQLVLRDPVGAWHGDRGVLRDASASRTVAGFRVLDPHAPARYRRAPERVARLAALALSGALERNEALLRAAPLGLELNALARSYAIADPRTLPLAADAIRIDATGEVAAAILPGALAVLEERIVERLAQFHATDPDEIGLGSERLRRLVAAGASPVIWRYALDRLVEAGRLRRHGAWLQLPRHGAELSAAEERLAQRLLPPMLQGGFDPPWVRDLARVAAAPEAVVRVTLANLARRGAVYAIVKDLYYPAATIEQLATLARTTAADDGGVAAAAFRDATGLGRKRAIQVLEFFDRAGYTRRVGDAHRLRSDIALFQSHRSDAIP